MADGRKVACIYVLAGPDLARSFALSERSTLGRSDACDVVLHDRSISRRHAVLVQQGDTWFVQDLGSTNGVSKDGQRAERFQLADGDEFKLGDLPLRFRLLEESRQDEIEFAPAVVDSQEHADARVEVRAQAGAPGARADDASDAPDMEVEIEGADEQPRHRPERMPLAATAYSPQRVARRTGFFAGDLEQRPLWWKSLVVLFVLAFCAGLCYGAFWAVHSLRAGL